MKAANFIPTALLMVALSAGGIVYAETGTDDPAPAASAGDPGKDSHKGWHHHHNELLQLLPEDKQKILHDTMEKTFKENKPLWEQARKLHEERDALLKSPKFDADAYLKKSAEIDALQEKLKQSHEQAIASVAAQFTLEERRVLLVMGHMKHHHHHGGEWNHHGKGPDGGDQGNTHQPS